ncbi:ATP-dependent carboxylate-amine ligase [Planotetraspora sp. A-T 1434]|uniref:MvdC/MvdD family ATP grasp protein n=1 Tax=Planotetraspora sp. A-T 1434 TaxID=2979219 RepID=UPI0021C0EB0B|nr:ATP-dependent carboxylate-amine ligase [Planotetraspora sp. A-T 1434]MCT9929248.1 ATP-dependent carboxylate-amine ligase [Planotetraspora sp. A-T 1434]
MTPTVLVLTQDGDEHADHVVPMLVERGATVVRHDPARFPKDAALQAAFEPHGPARRSLWLGDATVDLETLTAVWFRRPNSPVVHDEIAGDAAREYAERECGLLVRDIWESLDCRLFPARHSVLDFAQRKQHQLAVATRLGFEIPPTLITTQPDEVLDFYNRHEGRIVSKPYGYQPMSSVGVMRYTEQVLPADLGYVDAVRFCPMIFQVYVPKRVELRVTVVGSEVFAAEIHSQASNRARHDWRSYDLKNTPHFPHRLPEDVHDRCLRLVRKLGLSYGAIDLILTPDGRYVFLEINPSGQYLWIERLTGLPISAAVCDFLLGR